MQKLTVRHTTTYRYRRPVTFGPHRLMLRPRDSHDLRLNSATLEISPSASLRWMYDVFGNSVAIAEFGEQADVLSIQSQIVIERFLSHQPEIPIEPFARVIPFSYPTSEVPDLGRTIERHYSDPDRLITDWTRQFLSHGAGQTSTDEFLLAITRAIKQQFTYEVRHEPGVQPPVTTLERQAGSCRDFAILMMEAVRSVGLAARFVTGYLYDPAIDGHESQTVGAGSTHAWVQVYLPGAGWLEFDPTNGSYGEANLVPIAVAREPSQAMPVSGSFEGDPDDFISMNVEVMVTSEQSLQVVA